MEGVAHNLIRREQLAAAAPHFGNIKEEIEIRPHSMRLPQQQSLTLRQLSTTHLRTLAASIGLSNVDAIRPELLASLTATLTSESKQQWVNKNAEVSYTPPIHCDKQGHACMQLQCSTALSHLPEVMCMRCVTLLKSSMLR